MADGDVVRIDKNSTCSVLLDTIPYPYFVERFLDFLQERKLFQRDLESKALSYTTKQRLKYISLTDSMFGSLCNCDEKCVSQFQLK